MGVHTINHRRQYTGILVSKCIEQEFTNLTSDWLAVSTARYDFCQLPWLSHYSQFALVFWLTRIYKLGIRFASQSEYKFDSSCKQAMHIHVFWFDTIQAHCHPLVSNCRQIHVQTICVLSMLLQITYIHDDVSKWKHFLHCWPFVREIHQSLVNSPDKGQWHGTLMFSLICACTYGWVSNRDAGDLRLHSAHYEITVMLLIIMLVKSTLKGLPYGTWLCRGYVARQSGFNFDNPY